MKKRLGGRTIYVRNPSPLPPPTAPTPPQPTPVAPPAPPAPITPPTPQQVQQGNVLPKGGIDYDTFMQMSDDDKADAIADMLDKPVPLFLDDSGMQKIAYWTGLASKPQVVTDSQLDSMKGYDLYRTVSSTYNRTLDIGYSAKEILDQISTGDFTMYSDSGGSAYGKAIYFADNYIGSRLYGRGNGKDLMMRAKILPTAKTITSNQLANLFVSAYRRGDKLARACNSDYTAGANAWALAKGYDVVIDSGSGYHMVLNRRALAVSSTFKDPYKKSSW